MGHMVDEVLNILKKSDKRMSLNYIQKIYFINSKQKNRINDNLTRTSFERALKVLEKYGIKVKKEFDERDKKNYYILQK